MEKQLPKNWIESKLGNLVVIERGGSPRPIENYLTDSEDGINWIKISDATASDKYIYKTKQKIKPEGLYKTRYVREGDFLLSNSMSFGRPYIMKTDGCIHDGWLALKEGQIEIFNTEFLYYLLSSSFVFNQFDSLASGSTVRNLNKELVSSVIVKIPPLAEQNRIVEKLDTFFLQLENIKTSMAKIPLLLKDFRQQVLTQAVTGKLTNCNVKEKRLGDLLIDVKYGTSMKSEYEIDGTPIFRIPNINDGEINDLDLKYSILNDKEYNQLKLVEGDVLIIRSNGSVTLVGRSAIIRKKHEGFSYAGYLIRLRCGQELNSEFLNYSLKSDFLRTQIVSTSHSSSGVNNINSQEIKDLKIFWAQPKEQLEIVKRIEILFTKADAIEQQYHSLKQKIDTLPQALLHKAFKGELTEQLDSDGDARELLRKIQELKGTKIKGAKNTKLQKLKDFATKTKKYPKIEDPLVMVAEPNQNITL